MKFLRKRIIMVILHGTIFLSEKRQLSRKIYQQWSTRLILLLVLQEEELMKHRILKL